MSKTWRRSHVRAGCLTRDDAGGPGGAGTRDPAREHHRRSWPAHGWQMDEPAAPGAGVRRSPDLRCHVVTARDPVDQDRGRLQGAAALARGHAVTASGLAGSPTTGAPARLDDE